MNTKLGDIILTKTERSSWIDTFVFLFLLIIQSASVGASDLSITGIDVAALPGGRLQIQMQMNGAAFAPKVFRTDNPARIALDFSGVKNGLEKKMIPVNQGTASSIYVAEAADRVRVVVNLLESTPFETKVLGNKVLLTLNPANNSRPAILKQAPEAIQRSRIPVA